MEAAMDPQTEEKNELVEEQDKEEERETGDDMEAAAHTEEMEKEAMDLQNEEQNKLVEDQCQEDAGGVPDLETAPTSFDDEDDDTEEIEEEREIGDAPDMEIETSN
ncbi:uncharacterized protein LOC119368122 [Triticum dicoccoides]|uniref:uncharacterized protein LOC119368122 n=1 Tax=Triticum dicoccoides TaxID=85692 RepID=UPI0018902E7B|nr:uncharacterized protein LOC119368122 [Triticum dicoccoides]